jgi:hypothetical protein
MDFESLARLFPKFHLYKHIYIYIVVEPSALHMASKLNPAPTGYKKND